MALSKDLDTYLPELYGSSIFSLLYSREEFEAARARFAIRDCDAGEEILREGEPHFGLLLPLRGTVDLFSSQFEATANGMVTPYRTINTFAAIREAKSSYSARFRDAGVLLTIPRDELEARLRRDPAVHRYLLAVTENLELRTLAKDLDALGCSQRFKVELIAALEPRVFDPQQWISRGPAAPVASLLVLDGQAVAHGLSSQTGKVRQWPVPNRHWLLWRSAANQTAEPVSLKAVTRCSVVALPFEIIVDLRVRFAEDFARFDRRVAEGASSEPGEQDEGREVDLEELFKSAPRPKRSPWQGYPWVGQLDEMDCGPACLAMISQYYGRQVALPFWRHLLSTDRSGTSLFDLAQISDKNGFVSHALEVADLRELGREHLPAIALRGNHYVVIYEIDARGAVLGDPATGLVRMSLEEFNEGFENAVLVLRPTAAFNDLPVKKSTYGHFFELLVPFRKELLLGLGVSALMILLGLGGPMISQIFMDEVLVRQDLDLMWLLFAGGILLAICHGFLGWTRTYYSNFLASKIDYRLHSLLLKKTLALPYKFHADRHVGDFTLRFHDLGKLRSFLLHGSENLVLSALSLLVYGAALFAYAPVVGFGVLAAMPVFVLISWFSGRVLGRLNQEIFRHSAEVESTLTDLIKGVAAIKALGAELGARWRYEERLVRVLRAERGYETRAESFNVVFGLYSEVVKYSLMGLSVYLAIQGKLTPGQVVAVSILTAHVFDPLLRITAQLGDLQQMVSVFDRLNDVFLTPGEGAVKRGQLRGGHLRGEIEFRDVWFRYGGESSDWVLNGVSFKVEAGTKLAIAGVSGSGKSTVVGLLMRMFEPTRGQIFIDGRNYLDYDIDWLREKLGVLAQESPLFAGTILENIAFSEPKVDLEAVAEAASMAGAAAFIEAKPGGYDYTLNHGGAGLSGGEKQKLVLARMFHRRPDVLLLDEATSSLDAPAETELLDNLWRRAGGRTVIHVAHRSTAIERSEMVLVLAAGRVVGFGSHEHLAMTCEAYAKLFPFDPRVVAAKTDLRSA